MTLESLECPICHEIFVEPMVSTCGHSVCGICVETMHLKQCPICRKNSKYNKNYSLRSLVEASENKEAYTRRLEEFELLWSVDKNEERLNKLIPCNIVHNTYDYKNTIKIINKIYAVCSIKVENLSPTLLRDTLKSEKSLVIVSSRPCNYVLTPSVVKYYMVMQIGRLNLIIMSNVLNI